MILPGATGRPSLTWWFVFFLGSGFAGLVYEVVWLRLAMAAFGVTTPLVSIVLSVFMAGLALGSWLGGRLSARGVDARRGLVRYAAAEAAIGVLALAVPSGLRASHAFFAASGTTLAWDSAAYHLVSGVLVALMLLPCCTAMGATFPLAMAAIRTAHPDAGARAFSFLYLANVLGAACGTLASAFVLVELLGFRATLAIAVAVNVLIAAAAFARSRRLAPAPAIAAAPAAAPETAAMRPTVLACLFVTGLVSMAMEVVWIRQLTPYLGNLVYAFAGILAMYLVATFLGSRLYRTWIGPETCARAGGLAWLVAGVAGLLPLVVADPRLAMLPPVRLLLGVTPFCAAVGILTPMLVDRWSAGGPDRAGAAYAVNVLGSIAGPLLAGFVLLPAVGEHTALVLLALPLFVAAAAGIVRPALVGADGPPSLGRAAWVPIALGLAAIVVLSTRSFETRYPERQVRRDHTATVIVTGTGMARDLLINGTSTTVLTPVTKWMAHVPLAFLERRPADALVICFGMGTTFRSLLSWDIRVTAVELVPSVPEFFSYFHADAWELMRSANARVVIDDGRRFLERSPDIFDVITIDPPNPPEAAGSSLLYSREFYTLARTRLRPGGILQQWIPATDLGTVASVTRALAASFPHVRAFPSVNLRPTLQVGGIHYLASDRPIPRYSVAELVERLPARAAWDLIEWPIEPTVEGNFARLLGHEMPLAALTRLAPRAPVLADDRPFNEYFLLRRWVFAQSQPGS